jgi:hypothetical protein
MEGKLTYRRDEWPIGGMNGHSRGMHKGFI